QTYSSVGISTPCTQNAQGNQATQAEIRRRGRGLVQRTAGAAGERGRFRGGGKPMRRPALYRTVSGLVALLLAALALPGSGATTQAWKPAQAPLMTPWAKDVSP